MRNSDCTAHLYVTHFTTLSVNASTLKTLLEQNVFRVLACFQQNTDSVSIA